MENYRTKLKHQNIIFALSAMALIATQILAYARVITPDAGNSHWRDSWNGFIAGLAFAVMAFMIFGLVKNLIALKNPEKLKKQYVKENDERKIRIIEKGQANGSSAFLRSMPAAIIISGYFNITVCITLVTVTFALGIFMVIGKLYFNKKI